MSRLDDPPAWLTQRRMNVSLVVLGFTSVLLYRWSAHATTPKQIMWFLELALSQSALYLIIVWLLLRAREYKSTFLIVILFAALFRFSLLFFPPYLSDDIYRYIWDGRVQAAAINPYRYIPADTALAKLRDEKIYPRINRRDYAHTMYPPVAEGIFFLTTRVGESVTWMKATMVCFEALTIWALTILLSSYGLARQRVLVYAWHPLAVWEFAGSGHLDAIAIGFIALALLATRRKFRTATGVLLGCATLVKLFPIVMFPALYRRRDWKMPAAFAATITVGYLPYLAVGPLGVLGFLPGYANERGMTTGEQFYLLAVARRLFSSPHLPLWCFFAFVLCLLSLITIRYGWKPVQDDITYVRRALILACTFTVLLAPHFPWYFSWLIPFICFLPLAPLLYLTIASFLLYATWLGDKPEQMFLLNSLIYLPFAALWIFTFWNRHKRLKVVRDWNPN